MKRFGLLLLAALLLGILIGRWLLPTATRPGGVASLPTPEPVGAESGEQPSRSQLPPVSAAAAGATRERRAVVRVVDGDTLLLDGGERVRLIGVDTPETVRPDWPQERFGNEASAFTRRMAERKRVWLEYDPQVGRKDRYERTLAYVYLPDGTLLNREIIRRGYGHVYTRFPFSRIREFKAAEREAREKGLGLWAGAPSR